MAQTMAERLFERGKAQGLEIGKAQILKQAIELGERRAKQEILLKILRFRFGSVPESMTNEITSIQSLSRLDLLLEKAMTAWALNEIDRQIHDG